MWMIFLSFLPLLGWKCIKRVKPNKALVKHRLGHDASVKYSGYDVILPWIGAPGFQLTINDTNLYYTIL